MKKTFRSLVLLCAFSSLYSCASIVSKSNWPVSIRSTPAGATVTVTNRNGTEVYKGTTPSTIMLKSGSGFFKKESYQISFELEGYAVRKVPLECRINGWYWGNLLLGGILGMLIIDPATGAMYKIDDMGIWETLDATATSGTGRDLKICSISDIPAGMEKHLVKLN